MEEYSPGWLPPYLDKRINEHAPQLKLKAFIFNDEVRWCIVALFEGFYGSLNTKEIAVSKHLQHEAVDWEAWCLLMEEEFTGLWLPSMHQHHRASPDIPPNPKLCQTQTLNTLGMLVAFLHWSVRRKIRAHKEVGQLYSLTCDFSVIVGVLAEVVRG